MDRVGKPADYFILGLFLSETYRSHIVTCSWKRGYSVLYGIAWAASGVVVLTWEFHHVRITSFAGGTCSKLDLGMLLCQLAYACKPDSIFFEPMSESTAPSVPLKFKGWHFRKLVDVSGYWVVSVMVSVVIEMIVVVSGDGLWGVRQEVSRTTSLVEVDMDGLIPDRDPSVYTGAGWDRVARS
ncbi:hypothetical protein Tco_0553842 [Tanacetum coccineum]